MTKPIRIQLSRRKGFNLQDHSRSINGLEAIVVSRPSKYSNPHDWRDWMDTANSLTNYLWHADERENWAKSQAAEEFAYDIRHGNIKLDLKPLRNKNLACWCGRSNYCHADVLLELANKHVCEEVK